jgi:hypothetical protein
VAQKDEKTVIVPPSHFGPCKRMGLQFAEMDLCGNENKIKAEIHFQNNKCYLR